MMSGDQKPPPSNPLVAAAAPSPPPPPAAAAQQAAKTTRSRRRLYSALLAVSIACNLWQLLFRGEGGGGGSRTLTRIGATTVKKGSVSIINNHSSNINVTTATAIGSVNETIAPVEDPHVAAAAASATAADDADSVSPSPGAPTPTATTPPATSVIITSSLIPTHPSIDMVNQTIQSLQVHLRGLNLSETPIFVTVDGLPPNSNNFDNWKRLKDYAANLREEFDGNGNSQYPNVRVLESDVHLHIAGSVRMAMDHVGTKYVYVLQHDLPFARGIDHVNAVKSMEQHPTLIRCVRFYLKPHNNKPRCPAMLQQRQQRQQQQQHRGNSSSKDTVTSNKSSSESGAAAPTPADFHFNGLDFYQTTDWSDK